MHKNDMSVEVALALGSVGAVWTLELGLLATLVLMMLRQTLPVLVMAAAYTTEARTCQYQPSLHYLEGEDIFCSQLATPKNLFFLPIGSELQLSFVCITVCLTKPERKKPLSTVKTIVNFH